MKRQKEELSGNILVSRNIPGEVIKLDYADAIILPSAYTTPTGDVLYYCIVEPHNIDRGDEPSPKNIFFGKKDDIMSKIK